VRWLLERYEHAPSDMKIVRRDDLTICAAAPSAMTACSVSACPTSSGRRFLGGSAMIR